MTIECASCDTPHVTVKCSCGKLCCDECFEEHQARKPEHTGEPYPSGPSRFQRYWSYVKGSVWHDTDAADSFVKDEAAKWFGLVEETQFNPPVCRIVETSRFAEIIEGSKTFSPSSPRRQYPSLVSFVGDTGAGKSSLIRALIGRTTHQVEDLVNFDAPVVGKDDSLRSTTGEVNLYCDPATYGTSNPHLYVDCEGLGGSKPVAAAHQKKWSSGSRGYIVHSDDGNVPDRIWAVGNLYPKFIYIFSDVICYVERNPRGFALIVENLLRWASVAAQEAINQYALPAVILVLNGPPTGNSSWISGHPDALTREFFEIVEGQMTGSTFVKRLAEQYGVNSVEAILNRCFSSIHVLYIPLIDYKIRETGEVLGSEENMELQYGKLHDRIKSDSERVQAARKERWMSFDSKQLTLAFHFAFKHLTSRKNRPFDFSECRSQTDLPNDAQRHVTEFLKSCLDGDVRNNFDYAASVLGSCVVIRRMEENGDSMFHHPKAVLDDEMQNMFRAAISTYLDTAQRCGYVDATTSVRCVNTKDGHAKGHQGNDGQFLADGEFQTLAFDSTDFEARMNAQVEEFLQHLSNTESNQMEALVSRFHRNTIQQSNSFTKSYRSKVSSARTCFGCLFRAPEYRLPCGHHLCNFCVHLFDQSSDNEFYPSLVVHRECFLCSENDPSYWPFELAVRPQIGGVRVLSLDGGGVRGIVELVTLKKLQKALGLSIPPAAYFDLMVGTSAGGMIALGLGEHRWSVNRCLKEYERLTRTGFEAKAFTKWWGIGWLARWFRQSIYTSERYEGALSATFSNESEFFGLSTRALSDGTKYDGTKNLPRVVVTTTVDTQLKLFANYSLGGSGDYLMSDMESWRIARSTSAAPLYFEPYTNHAAGVTCRDGGLRANNPIQTALNEARVIWDKDVTFDAIVSLGSGYSLNSPSRPTGSNLIVPDWLTALFDTFMTTFNGEDAWTSFYNATDAALRPRLKRLNVAFGGDTEPALDDVDRIEDMKRDAAVFEFKRKKTTFVEPQPRDAILDVATQLRASLFFFHPSSIEYNRDRGVAVVSGSMFCRLDTNERCVPFRELHKLTEGFSVVGKVVPLPSYEECVKHRLRVPISWQHDLTAEDQMVDLRTKFMDGYSAPVSGFPIAFEEIQRLVPRSE